MLNAHQVNFYYGANKALNNISLNIESNTVMAFIGPSGCGKSTFLRLFNRMNDLIANTKIEGEIKVNGQNIYLPNVDVENLRKRVGMVFQKPNPFPKSIFDNVAYGLIVNGETSKSNIKAAVEKSLIQAALWDEVKDVLNESALSLSGGQQQRLCIARAIAVNPDVILMDEPCSALDPISTRKIEETILDLKKNYTIVIVTHNMQQAQRVSDNTAFFYQGDLVESNSTKDMFESPVQDLTQRYLTGDFG